MRIFERKRAGRLVAAAVCSGALVAMSLAAMPIASAQEESSNPCAPTEQRTAGAAPALAPAAADLDQDPCGGPPGTKNPVPTYTPSPTTTTTPAPPAAVPAAIKVAPAFTG